MQIELYIDGEKKIFTAPFVPMLAKRKFLEIEAAAEKRREEKGDTPPTAQEQLEEDDKILSILTDIIFKKQFTIEQLLEGASKEYIDAKLLEAVWGIKPEDETKKEDSKGNGEGE